tara:strand:+ start:6094 stop:6543 length:450 start_codon:yes stop_codon:yes gene_type:complete
MNDIQLSKNFKLSEFVYSDTAAEYGIDNTPNERQIKNIALLCIEVLQPVRDNFGAVKITSGFRCGRLNNHYKIRGAPHSHHRCHSGFAAADFQIDKIPKTKVIDWIKESNLPFEQLIDEPNWIHISTYRPRRQVMKAERVGTEMVYTLI